MLASMTTKKFSSSIKSNTVQLALAPLSMKKVVPLQGSGSRWELVMKQTICCCEKSWLKSLQQKNEISWRNSWHSACIMLRMHAEKNLFQCMEKIPRPCNGTLAEASL